VPSAVQLPIMTQPRSRGARHDLTLSTAVTERMRVSHEGVERVVDRGSVQRGRRVRCEHLDRAICAASASGAGSRRDGKEKVYDSIP
jgi:hypothetical protein